MYSGKFWIIFEEMFKKSWIHYERNMKNIEVKF